MIKHQIIKDETDDQIILADNLLYKIYIVSCFIVLGAFSALFSIYVLDGAENEMKLLKIFYALLAPLMLYHGLYYLLVSNFVIIDKKSQNIIIKKDSIIKRFKCIKEIPLSDIEEVNATYEFDSDYGKHWKVYVKTTLGEHKKIYDASGESDANRMEKKIYNTINRFTG